MYHVAVDTNGDGRTGWIAAAAVAVLILLLLPGLSGRAVVVQRDLGSHELGWVRLWKATVLSGRIPLWDPLTVGGTPFLANPNTLAVYPPLLLFLLLPLPVAQALFLLLHQLALGLGTHRLLRRLGLARGPAAAGAIAVAGSGLAFSQSLFLTGPATLALIPFLLASAVGDGGHPAAGRRRLAEAVLAGGLLLMTGKPAVAAVAWGAWLLLLLAYRRSGWRWSLAAPFLAAALAAPVLLPGIELARDSWRVRTGTTAAAVAADAFAPRRWPELVLPRLYGDPVPELPGGFWARPSFPWLRYEVDLHVGTIALLLLGLAAGRREARPWLLLTGGLVLLAALPEITVALRRIAPPLRFFRFSIKYLVPAAVTAAPLVALGAARAMEEPGTVRRRALMLAAALAPLAVLAADRGLLTAALGRLYPASAVNLALPGVAAAVARGLALDLATAIVPLLLVALSPRRLLLPALALQLLCGGAWALHWDDWSVWRSPPELARRLGPGATVVDLQRFGSPSRPAEAGEAADPVRRHYRGLRAALATHYGTLYGIAYRGVTGPDGTEPEWMHRLALRFRHATPARALRAARHVGASWVLLDRVPPPGPWTAIAVSAGPWRTVACRFATPLPGAWFPRTVLQLSTEDAVWAFLTDPASAPGETVAVLGHGPAIREQAAGRCRVLAHRPGAWRLETDTPGGGLLVLDAADSRTWRARTASGRTLPTRRVNGILLGVEVPAGRRTVTVEADARPFLTGVAIALGALLLTALLAAGAPTRGRRTPTGGAAPTRQANPPAP